MTRRVGALPLLAVVALAVAGCADAVAGTPVVTAGPVSSPTGPPTSALSMSIDPCQLLTGSDIQQLGLAPRGRDTLGGGRACSWFKTGQYTVGVEVFDHTGINGIDQTGHQVSDHPVGSHDGREILDQIAGGCGIVMAITTSSFVDVNAAAALGDQQSCQLAEQYALLIEPRLPAEQK